MSKSATSSKERAPNGDARRDSDDASSSRGTLSQAFSCAFGGVLPEGLPRGEQLEAELLGLFDGAEAQEPGIDLDGQSFVAHVAGGLSEGQDLSGLNGPGIYLACACLARRPGAAERFEELLRATLKKALAKTDLSPDQRAELAQRIREKLLVTEGQRRARLESYSGRGTLSSWLMVVAVRELRDLLRRERKHRAVGDDRVIDHLAPHDDPELVLLKERYRVEFAHAVKAAFASLPGKHRTLLRYHYVDGLSIDRIGRIYSVHRATAARWLGKAREDLQERARQEMVSLLRVDSAELDSIVRLIQSQLHVTLSQLLSPTR